MTEQATEVRGFPFAVTGLAPPPEYTELRTHEPVARVRLPYGGDAWLVTRQADVKTVLADPRFSRAAASREDAPRFEPVPPPPVGVFVSDPPEHSRLRGLVAKAFTHRRVESLRPRVRELVESFCAGLAEHGSPADFVAHFALPLPVQVISELLGIPEDDRQRFGRWCEGLLSTTSMSVEEINEARGNLFGFLADLVRARQQEPTDDLLGALARARAESEVDTADPDRLTEREIVVFAGGLLVAGYETSASQLANFTYLMLRDRRLWRRLHDEPSVVPAAVEEMLRYVPSLNIGGFTRVASEDVELSGVTVRAGETVVPVLASANWDESVFDAPDTVDFDRAPNPHIAFGHGAHRCVGAALAKVELQEAFSLLPQRFPDLRLAGPDDAPRFKSGVLVHGIKELPVRW